MTNYNGASLEEQIKKLLEQNLAYSQEIYRLSKKVKKYILWGRILSSIQILFIVVPLVLGFIYLPSIIGNALGSFGISPDIFKALGNFSDTNATRPVDQGNLEELLKGQDPAQLYKAFLQQQQN